MKFAIGILLSFAVGAACRLFDIPVPSPPFIPGALLVLVMTMGYSSTSTFLDRRNRPATTTHLCGGPTGVAVASERVKSRPTPGALPE